MAEARNDAVGNDASKTRGEGDAVRSLVAGHSAVASEPNTAERKRLRKRWAALIRRVYEIDPLLCACGATMRIVAIITERSVITKILTHPAKAAAANATEGSGPGPPHHPGRRPIPPSTEPSTTGWRDDRRGRSLLVEADAAAQTHPTQLSRRLHASAPPKWPLFPSKINPESSASMGKGARSLESHTPWSRTGNAFSYPLSPGYHLSR